MINVKLWTRSNRNMNIAHPYLNGISMPWPSSQICFHVSNLFPVRPIHGSLSSTTTVPGQGSHSVAWPSSLVHVSGSNEIFSREGLGAAVSGGIEHRRKALNWHSASKCNSSMVSSALSVSSLKKEMERLVTAGRRHSKYGRAPVTEGHARPTDKVQSGPHFVCHRYKE